MFPDRLIVARSFIKIKHFLQIFLLFSLVFQSDHLLNTFILCSKIKKYIKMHHVPTIIFSYTFPLFSKYEKSTCFFSRNMLVYLSSRQTHPGVAKFGIALEWGSRGLEFESRHSDQKSRNSICCFCFFLCVEIRTIHCECPVDIRLLPA